MGRLIEKLEKMQRSTGTRLGFGPATTVTSRSLAIVGVLASTDAKLAVTAVENGADALLVRSGGKKTAPNIPEGIPLGVERPSAEADFDVVEMSDPLTTRHEGADGDTLLLLDQHLPDEVFRTLEALPVDGYIVSGLAAPATYESMVGLYRVTRATTKPVLVRVETEVDASVLRALRDGGVSGVMVDVGNASQAKSLASLRKALDSLPAKKKRSGRGPATLPQGMPSGAPAAEEDDDDLD